ncbi:PqqD family protein [Sphingobacterium endophyticum]|uniref:PqqD family protein n=1 Tax=Sphingobacterium endophyticum TaxID=2546448 RepID=UPI0012E1AD90|nr:PqqD family protein [Sphingobacterium endophyticum]
MRLRGDLTLRKIGNEYMIVEPGKDMVDLSKVYSLNKTAAFLWNELQGRDFSEDDVAEILIEEYGLTPRTAYIDGTKMLQHFKAEKLIR